MVGGYRGTNDEKKKSSKQRPTPKGRGEMQNRTARAQGHGKLANELVHVFVDDQNLFWGIVNQSYGPAFRIDFGKLSIEAARTLDGRTRGIASAYIAGVIPDDDSFWKIAENQGFAVRRGFLGSNGRSKQDDAYLVTDLVRTICEEEGPATVVLIAGDADYVPPLKLALERQWRIEIAFVEHGISRSLEPVAHEFRFISPANIEYSPL